MFSKLNTHKYMLVIPRKRPKLSVLSKASKVEPHIPMSDQKTSERDSNEANYSAITTILNSLDALVYVADIGTHELLFFNDYGQTQWGAPEGRRCWEVLQKGQQNPCDFCTNPKLVNEHGEPSGVYVWEFQNTHNGSWYQCRDQLIKWPDGRLVRIEIATDITERKLMEQELHEAKVLAEKAADTDVLTGLNNRRSFFKRGNEIISDSNLRHHPISVIMFDLDYFKQINDDFGHDAGDEVLIDISHAAVKALRQDDIFARLGGEEFAVLLPNTNHLQAIELAELIRKALDENITIYNNEKISCTASFGVSSKLDLSKTSLKELISEADKKLYRAKNNGRNTVIG